MDGRLGDAGRTGCTGGAELRCGAKSSDSKLYLSQPARLGSIRRRTAEMRFAGKPPRRALTEHFPRKIDPDLIEVFAAVDAYQAGGDPLRKSKRAEVDGGALRRSDFRRQWFEARDLAGSQGG